MFTAAKDAIASQAARSYANGLIKRYGEVLELKIDSKAKTVYVQCTLIGERDPVTVHVESYRVVNEGAKSYVEIKACSCSRPWIHNLIEDHAYGRRVEIPGWAAAAL